LANLLEDIYKIKVGAVDIDNDPKISAQYSVKTAPTIKFFGINKENPKSFTKEINLKELINFIAEESKNMIFEKLNVKEEEKELKKQKSDVIMLNEKNFEEIVMKSKEPVFI